MKSKLHVQEKFIHQKVCNLSHIWQANFDQFAQLILEVTNIDDNYV